MSGSEDGSVQEFLAEAEEILEAVSDGLMALERCPCDDDVDPEVINGVFRGAHSLKGIAAMCGYVQVTELSHKMETLLDGLRMGRVARDSRVVGLLLRGVDLLKRLCGRLAQGKAPEDDGVPPFVDQLLAAAGAQNLVPGGDLGELGLAPEALQVLTEYEVHRLRETVKNPKRRLYRVSVSLPVETFDGDLERLSDALKRCGEIISTVPTPDAASPDHLDFDLLVGAKADASAIVAAADSFGGRVATLGRTIAESAAAPPVSPQQGGDTLQTEEKGRGAPSVIPDGDAEPDLRSFTRTVRVDLGKLDALMNLVGELVLTKGRIQLLAGKLKERLGFSGEALEISKVHKEFERRLAELQESVMDVRMVPLGQLFSKLHRVVRRIVQSSGKEVDLEISGAETELDKLIVEDLSDPLIHVIRNAVDHGIEHPDVREAAGKPRRGTIRIDAKQRGNHVVLAVADDGAGLSREAIRRKAEERGLLSPSAPLDDRDLLDLVFVPGFSTKDEVTELSGRGVGMDVLRKNIGRLSGLIDLSSKPGKGTTVTISLPITLAIIQALLVRAGEQTYAVPLNTVLETLALDPGQVNTLEGRPVLRLRGSTLPLVRVNQLLGDTVQPSPAEFAVVVGVAEKRVAFGVDDLLTQQDVVIKSLGSRLRRIPGLAGATDLGDQRTVLVLDVGALVDEVYQAA
jgi:two-component system chemotaxis sensor kinase CheA